MKAHKASSGCTGVKAKNPIEKLSLQQMSIQTIRSDMKVLEDGIHLSNKAKKENCLAKVGASMTLGIKPIDPKQARKLKTLKQFLRRKRNINYFASPSPLFSRSR